MIIIIIIIKIEKNNFYYFSIYKNLISYIIADTVTRSGDYYILPIYINIIIISFFKRKKEFENLLLY